MIDRVREGGRERERGGERGRGREGERQNMALTAVVGIMDG